MAPRRQWSARTGPALLCALWAAAVLSGCGPAESGSSPAPASSAPSTEDSLGSLEDFRGQEVVWESCEEDFECTTVQVPVDYGAPDGERVGLALIRHRAEADPAGTGSGEDSAAPVLLTNPGGPGGSGYDMVAEGYEQTFGPSLREHFDVVGFDPRGVDRSSGFSCGDRTPVLGGNPVYEDEQDQEEADPRDDIRSTGFRAQEAIKDYSAENQEFFRTCQEEHGGLVEHMGTEESARDMDVIRAVLGQETLHYLGFSYGTQLGGAYATLFPEHTGPMVLDGVLDAGMDPYQQLVEQSEGFEDSLRHFVARCQEGRFGEASDCPLRAEDAGAAEDAAGQDGSATTTAVDAGMERLARLLEDVEGGGYRTANGREFTADDFRVAAVGAMYSVDSHPYLAQGLQNLAEDHDPTLLMRIADLYLGRDADGNPENDSGTAQSMVVCADNSVEASPEPLERMNEYVQTLDPVLRLGLNPAPLQCAGWPASSMGDAFRYDASRAATTPLLIGTSHDPATPGAWAEAFAQRWGKARVLRHEGWSHTAYRQGSSCTDDAVEAYLVQEELPAEGTVCR